MDWLNYHHLLYFWTIVREGTVARAAERLSLAQPTISGQLRTLEQALGEKLFTRVGRRLVLTDTGRLVYRYADEIFSIGRELTETLKGHPSGRTMRLAIGVADAVPKLIAYRLLQPALALPEPVHLICREDKPDRLLADLAVHALDVVLTDTPTSPSARVRAYFHLLGECGISFFGVPALASRYRKGFPESLDHAPMLLPADDTALRRSLDEWFEATAIHPLVIGEFDDSALLKAVGEAGHGIFPVPTAIEREVRKQYKVALVGRTDKVRARFYAVSVERRLKHPAVVAIADGARKKLFG